MTDMYTDAWIAEAKTGFLMSGGTDVCFCDTQFKDDDRAGFAEYMRLVTKYRSKAITEYPDNPEVAAMLEIPLEKFWEKVIRPFYDEHNAIVFEARMTVASI